MRTAPRKRRYIAPHWLTLLRPMLRHSRSRDAYIVRVIGAKAGPVLRVDRRTGQPFDGVDRRRARPA
jgi:hypothetical protein